MSWVYLLVAIGVLASERDDGEPWYWATITAAVWPAFVGVLLMAELKARYTRKAKRKNRQ